MSNSSGHDPLGLGTGSAAHVLFPEAAVDWLWYVTGGLVPPDLTWLV